MLEKIEIERENSFLKKFVKELEARNIALCEMKRGTDELNSSLRHYNEKPEQGHGPEGTETLLDICRDVTLNPVLRKVLNGSMDLPYNNKLCSYDI